MNLLVADKTTQDSYVLLQEARLARSTNKNNIYYEWNTHQKIELSFSIKISLIITSIIQTTNLLFIHLILLFIILYYRYIKPAPEVRQFFSFFCPDKLIPTLMRCYSSG